LAVTGDPAGKDSALQTPGAAGRPPPARLCHHALSNLPEKKNMPRATTLQSPAIRTRREIAAQLHEQVLRFTRELRSLHSPRGMTAERLSVLSLIVVRGPISVSALASLELVQPPSMSRMVNMLYQDGLITRTENAQDGRSVLLAATPKGLRIYKRARGKLLAHFAEALDRLNAKELETMHSIASCLERLTLTKPDER
jgi:DNA-binding MarR family transcriptional regulator